MDIAIQQVEGKPEVAVMVLSGDLDGSNYERVIERASEAYAAGSRHMLIDLGQVNYTSSAGLVALHWIVLVMNGQELPDQEDGWGAMRSVRRSLDAGQQTRVKLLNLQPKVDRALTTTGFKDFFEVYTDLDTALATF